MTSTPMIATPWLQGFLLGTYLMFGLISLCFVKVTLSMLASVEETVNSPSVQQLLKAFRGGRDYQGLWSVLAGEGPKTNPYTGVLMGLRTHILKDD